MTDDARAFLFDLLATPSPTGFEGPGQRVWAARVRPLATRVEGDAYGNAWATLDGADADAPTLLLAAHADEIGFIVKHVTDDGFVHVDRIGGADHAVARARRLVFLTKGGPVPGIVGNTAVHLRDRKKEEKAPEVHELFVDVGVATRDAVGALGLRVGTPAVYADTVEAMGDKRLVGRALDNRLGGFVLAEALALLAKERPAATVVALNAVQEEIGGHGARMAAYRLRPDVALVLDVTHATDSPGIERTQHGDIRLGRGPTVTHGTVNHPLVVQRLIETAEAEGVPLQHEASSRYSGTDADVVFVTRAGIPTALLSIPLRYMHSTVETADLDDVDHAIRLVAAFARAILPGDTFVTALE